MKEIVACGCIPFRRSRTREIEALMILRTTGFWEFPKGKKDPGETDEETALRELREETGLSGELLPEDPLTMTYMFEHHGVLYQKRVILFFCRVSDGSEPTCDRREVSDAAWLSLESLVDRATYPEMKALARQVHLTLGD